MQDAGWGRGPRKQGQGKRGLGQRAEMLQTVALALGAVGCLLNLFPKSLPLSP